MTFTRGAITSLVTPPQAVIIDDTGEEALAVVEALSQIGIPASWYRGQGRNGFPSTPLKGVRLFVLDLVLTGDTFNVSIPLDAIYSTISPTTVNGPFLLLIWTRHGEEGNVDSLKEKLNEYNSRRGREGSVIPLEIVTINKSTLESMDRRTGRTSYNIKKLTNNIISTWKQYLGFELMVYCESRNKLASSNLTAAISSLAIGDDLKQKDASLKRLLRRLASVSRGGSNLPQSMETAKCITALQETLSVLLLDAACSGLPSFDATTDSDALINHLLHFSTLNNDVHPGSIFRMEDLISIIESCSDLLQRQASWFQELFLDGYTPTNSILTLVEITALCDFAHQKAPQLRFIPGMIVDKVPDDKLRNSATYMHILGPVLHPTSNNAAHLILDSRWAFSIARDCKEISALHPLLQLRKHSLNVIQNWFASHSCRPGHLSLDKP